MFKLRFDWYISKSLLDIWRLLKDSAMVIHKSFSARVFGYQCPIHEMCQTCKRKMSVFLIVEKPG